MNTGETKNEKMRSGTRVFTGQLFRGRDGRKTTFSDKPPSRPEPVRRPARIARMLALAHSFQAEVDGGKYLDRADLARQLGLTRARVTQLLDLMLLAPDIQEEILFLDAVAGAEPVSERTLRKVTRHLPWAEQRTAWAEIHYLSHHRQRVDADNVERDQVQV
jgi:hypothetical protein